MQIFIAADHAGFELKRELKEYLKAAGYTVYDEGFFELNEDDDYPDVVAIVARQVGSNPEEYRGIVIGGSGEGEAMCANRIQGVRAAVLYSYQEDIIRLSRLHNNANILSLGARFISVDDAKRAVQLWLTTDFSREERHERRILKLDGTVSSENEF
mgnify:CR=1 FL=1